MFRKISFAAVAALALTAAAVAPASAGWRSVDTVAATAARHGMHTAMVMAATGVATVMATSWIAFYVGGSCYRTIFTKFGPRTRLRLRRLLLSAHSNAPRKAPADG